MYFDEDRRRSSRAPGNGEFYDDSVAIPRAQQGNYNADYLPAIVTQPVVTIPLAQQITTDAAGNKLLQLSQQQADQANAIRVLAMPERLRRQAVSAAPNPTPAADNGIPLWAYIAAGAAVGFLLSR